MKLFRFLGNEILLGTLIALLSVFTAMASYFGAMADSNQNAHEIEGMKALNDGNVLYLESNQIWIQDDGNYDNWYINYDTNPDIALYYEGNFTDSLYAAIERNGGDEYPMDDQYVQELFADANELFDQSDTNFILGSQWDFRGDQLQLVMLIMALGLALAAWGSLMHEGSNLRSLFSAFAILSLTAGLLIYFLAVPTVVG